METITLSGDLIAAVRKIVEKGGYRDPDQFVREAIEEKLSLIAKLSFKEEVFKIAGEIKEMMKYKDVQEEEILEEFEKFRKSMNQ